MMEFWKGHCPLQVEYEKQSTSISYIFTWSSLDDMSSCFPLMWWMSVNTREYSSPLTFLSSGADCKNKVNAFEKLQRNRKVYFTIFAFTFLLTFSSKCGCRLIKLAFWNCQSSFSAFKPPCSAPTTLRNPSKIKYQIYLNRKQWQ